MRLPNQHMRIRLTSTCPAPPRPARPCPAPPSTQVLDDANIRDPFVRNWLDLLSFLLSGLPADSTIAAEVAFMFNQW